MYLGLAVVLFKSRKFNFYAKNKLFVIKDFEIKFMKTIFWEKCKEMEMKEFKLLEVDSVSVDSVRTTKSQLKIELRLNFYHTKFKVISLCT